MAVTIHRAVSEQPGGPVVFTGRVYWDETRTRLLAEGHPDARFLAYPEGATVPLTVAEKVTMLDPTVVAEALPVEPAPNPAGSSQAKRTRRRADRQLAPGVVADTSIDGEAHVLVSEPGNGVDK